MCRGCPVKAEFLAFALGAVWRHRKDSDQLITSYQTENRHTSAGRNQRLRNRSWWCLPKHSKPVEKAILDACVLLMDNAQPTIPLLTGDADGQESLCLQLLWNLSWETGDEQLPGSALPPFSRCKAAYLQCEYLESCRRRKVRTWRQGVGGPRSQK